MLLVIEHCKEARCMGQEVLNLICFTMSGHGSQLYTAKQVGSPEQSQVPGC